MTLMDQNKNIAATKRYRSPIYAVTFSNHHQLKFLLNAHGLKRYRQRTAHQSIHEAVQFNSRHMFISPFALPMILVLCKREPVLNVNNGDAAVNGTILNGQHIFECRSQADKFSTNRWGMHNARSLLNFNTEKLLFTTYEFGAR